MRIKKQNQTKVLASQTSTVSQGQSVLDTATGNVKKHREEAIEYIHSAISALSNVAKEDKISKDSIANLSVVLLDLTAGEDSGKEDSVVEDKDTDTE